MTFIDDKVPCSVDLEPIANAIMWERYLELC